MGGGPAQQAGMEKRAPVEFNHAISYVNKIKVRIAFCCGYFLLWLPSIVWPFFWAWCCRSFVAYCFFDFLLLRTRGYCWPPAVTTPYSSTCGPLNLD